MNVKTTQTFTFDIELWKEFRDLSNECGLKRSFIINSIVKQWVKEAKQIKQAYGND